ncbi:hypothetical protein Leryth_023501 [Lithospermum erythrorhizon]|nr:hypothetical protein Leryth_023501 [Lithospermum erythrorhizon]
MEIFRSLPEAKINGHVEANELVGESHSGDNENLRSDLCVSDEQASLPSTSGASISRSKSDTPCLNFSGSCLLRDTLLFYITSGDDIHVSGSLSLLATLLQTKELDESMLDALGILPQRKQHKKFLLQALVGEDSGEEQLFSSRSSVARDSFNCELETCLQKLKDYYRRFCASTAFNLNLRLSRYQVLDALVSLFCRSNISAETLWDGGWLLRQLQPYSEAEFNSNHIEQLNDSFQDCANQILKEARGTWPDLLINVICDEWRKCKRAIEASSPRKDPLCMLLPRHNSFSGDGNCESSFTAGARMGEMVKVFVLLHQLHFFSLGKTLPDQPQILPPVDVPEKCRSKLAGLDTFSPKPSTELNLVDAVPCRIAFERGKERQFSFLAVSIGISGWVILAEELPLRSRVGVVRVAAPLAGCNPRIDEKHSRWLHLRIRPASYPFMDSSKYATHGKVKSKALVDGRWTLAFRDEESCKLAFSMILEEINLLSSEVERRVKPLLDLGRNVDSPQSSQSLECSRASPNVM